MTSGSLWNYYRDEIDDVDDKAADGKSFKYKIKIIGHKKNQNWLKMKNMQIGQHNHQYQL